MPGHRRRGGGAADLRAGDPDAWTRDGTGIAQALAGTAKTVLAWLLTGTVATAALAASDQVARFIVAAEFGSQARRPSWGWWWTGPGCRRTGPGDGGALLLVIGLIGILLVIVLWFELLLRNAAIAVLVATSPIAAAGQVSDATKAWWSRTVAATVQLVILKPVIALVFAVGFGMAGTRPGSRPLAGAAGAGPGGVRVAGDRAVLHLRDPSRRPTPASARYSGLAGQAASRRRRRDRRGAAGPVRGRGTTEARVMGGGGGGRRRPGGGAAGAGRRQRGRRGRGGGWRAGFALEKLHRAGTPGRADGADRGARRDARRVPVLDDLRRAAARAPTARRRRHQAPGPARSTERDAGGWRGATRKTARGRHAAGRLLPPRDGRGDDGEEL